MRDESVGGPDGNLYVTSLSNGAVYMISRKTPSTESSRASVPSAESTSHAALLTALPVISSVQASSQMESRVGVSRNSTAPASGASGGHLSTKSPKTRLTHFKSGETTARPIKPTGPLSAALVDQLFAQLA